VTSRIGECGQVAQNRALKSPESFAAMPAAAPAQLWERRRAGVLLHPTSLPGPAGYGVLGSAARRFVDLIAAAGFTVWQVLPLGPVDSSLSPYQLRSAQAGNPSLIDLDQVRRAGWIAGSRDLSRQDLLSAAAAGFRERADASDHADYHRFLRANGRWLSLFALFEAMHRAGDGEPWWHWPTALQDRDPKAISAALHEHRRAIREIIFEQYLFETQWNALKAYANSQDVLVIGDLPFYVERDSVEVWWHRKLFKLDSGGRPTLVAGVPPDYFSAEGQFWGNPVYDWERLKESGFKWWIDRVKHQLRLFDALRLDHFRGLESCWEIPANAESAREGRWQPVPGKELLRVLQHRFPDLQLIAEDLGTITPAVLEMRERFALPGMLVLQFAFDGRSDNPYLPANHRPDAVVYTGTHDNDTSLGWYQSLDDQSHAYVDEIIADGGMPAAMIGVALASPAYLAIFPLQDLLELGSESRLNVPGTPTGNWTWRFRWQDVPADFADRYRQLIVKHGRFEPAGRSESTGRW
jgi:4-alpha-glucanotransferase